MIPIILTCILGASVCTLVYRAAFGFGSLDGYRRAAKDVAAASNEMLNRELPRALEAARIRGAENCAQLLLPLLARHGLELEAIAILTKRLGELAAKRTRN